VLEDIEIKIRQQDQFGDDAVRNFNQDEHDSRSRLTITKMFLQAYFTLIACGFVFCLFYNSIIAYLNHKYVFTIEYLDVANTVSIITTTLSSGVVFVIGYYFKSKNKG
jgi:hypothetical protein